MIENLRFLRMLLTISAVCNRKLSFLIFFPIWVISHAWKNPDCYCVIDEEFGRKICNLFGVKLTGAIGILLKMEETGIIQHILIRD